MTFGSEVHRRPTGERRTEMDEMWPPRRDRPGPRDDARHSVLSRARPISQTGLSAFGAALDAGVPLLPRGDFGTYEVKEVDVKQGLTVCRMPGEPWSLNPYTGCSHDCAYCYVPDVAHVERARWATYVLVKRNLPTVLAHELKRKERREVFLSSATDCYQPAEATHLVTRRCVELLARADWPMRVLTRNPLIKRDLDLYHAFSDLAIGMSVPTLDDRLRALVEPAAPPIEGRLRTLRAMADAGFAPFANLMPCYPMADDVEPDAVAGAFAEAGVREVHAGGWRYMAGIEPVLRARLGEEAEPFVRKIQDPAYFPRLFARLAPAFTAHGIAFAY